MSMLQQWATGTNVQTTTGEYDYELPNTEPSGTAYVNWKAANYTTSATRNLGGSSKVDGTTVVDDTVNRWYNLVKMLKFRKILKRESKFNATNMSA